MSICLLVNVVEISEGNLTLITCLWEISAFHVCQLPQVSVIRLKIDVEKYFYLILIQFNSIYILKNKCFIATVHCTRVLPPLKCLLSNLDLCTRCKISRNLIPIPSHAICCILKYHTHGQYPRALESASAVRAWLADRVATWDRHATDRHSAARDRCANAFTTTSRRRLQPSVITIIQNTLSNEP